MLKCFCRLLFVSLFIAAAAKQLSPVILIPGYAGSQMEARLHKSTKPLFYCDSNDDWFNLWLDLTQLMITQIPCWADNIKLHYGKFTHTTQNTEGVDIRIPGWGNPEVVEWVDPTFNAQGANFKDVGNMLVKIGYQRKKSLLGAPYDFRKAPNEQELFFTMLKHLVEDAYDLNSKTPVTFITHSMGSTMTLAFLQQQTSEWKRKYVKRLISLAGAWGGSMKALKAFAMGDDMDSFWLNNSYMREALITNPSLAYMLPSPLFWRQSTVLVETPRRAYTLAQLESYFNDIGYSTGWEMRKDTLPYILNFSPPDVELHCLYGDGLDTVEKLRYDNADMVNNKPKLIMGKGDGTVNRLSLRGCHAWIGYQEANITNVPFEGVNHMGILASFDALNYIQKILLQ